MNKSDYKGMWVYIEHDHGIIHPVSLELCSEVRKLCDASGDAFTAVIIGNLPQDELEKILITGVDSLLFVSGTGYDFFSIDAYTHLFTELSRKYKPSAVFVGGTINGRDFAPRFACRLPTGCTSDATQLVYDKTTGREYSVIHETISFPIKKIRSKPLSFVADGTDDNLNIADAEVIVCVGNGLKGADSLPRYRKLAEILGGKLGCTRPVSDRNILPVKLVIGQSGVVVKPKLYLAFGVSGAVNHMTGATDSDIIVAINKDPDAPVFHYCTYGIIGDMDEICDQMIAQLSDRV